MKLGVQALRAIVRGFHAEGATLRRQIAAAHGPQRYALWERKRAIGSYARDHMIAYGLLRGLSYEAIERPGKFNRPDHRVIHEIMQKFGGWDLRLSADDVAAKLAVAGGTP